MRGGREAPDAAIQANRTDPAPVSKITRTSRTKKIETPPIHSDIPPESPARQAILDAFFRDPRPFDPRRPSPFPPFKRGCNGTAPQSPVNPAPPPDPEDEDDNGNDTMH